MSLDDFVHPDFIHPESSAYLELTRIAAQPDSFHKIMELFRAAEAYIDLGCYAVGCLLLNDLVAIYEALKICDDYQQQLSQYANTKRGAPFSPSRILRTYIRIGQFDEAYAIYLRWYEPMQNQERLSQQQFLKKYR